MLLHYMPVALLILAGILFSIKARKLTVGAALTGGVTGVLIFAGAGYTGMAMLTTFFILGTFATSWKVKTKEQVGAAEKNKGRRTTGQVIANAGMAGILGLLSLLYPHYQKTCITMMAAGFSSATADTLSSELGMVYGSRFYNILTLTKDQKGLDGVVSVEGTLIGIAGSFIIAILYATGLGWNANFLWIVAAGTIGNLSDSVLGATLERRSVLSNNAVNFLNTLIAALIALMAYCYS